MCFKSSPINFANASPHSNKKNRKKIEQIQNYYNVVTEETNLDYKVKQALAYHVKCKDTLKHTQNSVVTYEPDKQDFYFQLLKSQREDVRESLDTHRSLVASHAAANREVKRLARKYRGAIESTREYFDTQQRMTQAVQAEHGHMRELRQHVQRWKCVYAERMSELESISNGIHADRAAQQSEEMIGEHNRREQREEEEREQEEEEDEAEEQKEDNDGGDKLRKKLDEQREIHRKSGVVEEQLDLELELDEESNTVNQEEAKRRGDTAELFEMEGDQNIKLALDLSLKKFETDSGSPNQSINNELEEENDKDVKEFERDKEENSRKLQSQSSELLAWQHQSNITSNINQTYNDNDDHIQRSFNSLPPQSNAGTSSSSDSTSCVSSFAAASSSGTIWHPLM